MNNIKYTIHRYELYGNPPVGKLVGFLITNTDTHKNEYVETLVPLEQCKNKMDSEICAMAYNNLKLQISNLIISLTSPSPIIGSEFVP
jgi:hypothetical protein